MYCLTDFQELDPKSHLHQNPIIQHRSNVDYHPKIYSWFAQFHEGMINKAKVEYGLYLWNSVLIGDNHTDIQAGQNAGVGTNILFDEKN